MRRIVLIVILVLAARVGVATAQTCTPYWASAGPMPTAAESIRAIVHDAGDGEAIYSWFSTSTGRVYRFRNGGWTLIAAPSINGLPNYKSIYGLNELMIEGVKSLYLYTRYSKVHTEPGLTIDHYIHQLFRWTGTTWVPAPDGLLPSRPQYPEADAEPYLSADVGTGMTVFGRIIDRTNDRSHVGEWSPSGRWRVVGTTQAFSIGLASFDDGNGTALYAFGNMQTLNGMPVKGFAKWDGERWTFPWDEWIPSISTVWQPAVVDHGFGPLLYTNHAGGDDAGFLRRWNGDKWAIVPSLEVSQTSLSAITQMAVFDDGRGPALYIAGGFQRIQGQDIVKIARYDGATWEPLGAGILWGPSYGPFHRNMVAYNDPRRGPSLFVGATHVGGGVVPRYAQWVGCPNCYADCDLDRALTAADFVCFMSKYAALDPYANCTVDQTIDVADFNCFIEKYAAGCPGW
ncbi:MAG: hypothetical protein ACKVW3_08275 [Phycisphaerales bacterium]